jgi:hypothetical protein
MLLFITIALGFLDIDKIKDYCMKKKILYF